jgi:hypothetical protein
MPEAEGGFGGGDVALAGGNFKFQSSRKRFRAGDC